MVNLWTRGHLFLNLQDGIKERATAIEYQTIGVGNVLEHLLVNTVLATNSEVHTTILPFLGSNNIRWDILREGSTSLNHGTLSHSRLGILDDAGREDDIVLDDAVAGNLCTVAKDTAVAHLGIMRDVSTLHQHVLITNHCLSTSMGGTVDDDILTDDIAVADDTFRLLATELEVLWQGTDDGTLVYLVFLTHAGARADADKGEDDTAIAYLYIVFDISEGEYLYVVADFGLWTYLGFWTYFACHNYLFMLFAISCWLLALLNANSQQSDFIFRLLQELYTVIPQPASC